MSANAESIHSKTALLSEEFTKPFSGSKKIFVQGSREDLKVGMREICCDSTSASFGEEENPPISVYDTSGPYTEPGVAIDLLQGLPHLRSNWIEERGDTEVLSGPSSEFGQARQVDPKTAHLRFAHYHAPRRAKSGCNVTQMHYAKQGIITPEMEYIAIREDMRLQEHRKDPRYKKILKQHQGVHFGANIPDQITLSKNKY